MKDRTVYDVVPQTGRWAVKRRGAERADSVWDAKAEAVDRGAELCDKSQPSQLVIRRQDGTIEDERTYGSDPFPPRG